MQKASPITKAWGVKLHRRPGKPSWQIIAHECTFVGLGKIFWRAALAEGKPNIIKHKTSTFPKGLAGTAGNHCPRVHFAWAGRGFCKGPHLPKAR